MSEIDVRSASSAQQAALRQKIDIAIAKTGLEASRQSGQAVLELLASAAQLGKSHGKGGNLDTVA